MGCHVNINYDKFPTQSRSLGEKVILTYMGQTLLAVVERRDREDPNRIIWSVRDTAGRQIFLDSRMMANHPEIDFLTIEASKYTMEWQAVDMHFHFDTQRSVRAICVYDRGPCTIFKAIEGEFENYFYSATECQYCLRPAANSLFGKDSGIPLDKDDKQPAAAIHIL